MKGEFEMFNSTRDSDIIIVSDDYISGTSNSTEEYLKVCFLQETWNKAQKQGWNEVALRKAYYINKQIERR